MTAFVATEDIFLVLCRRQLFNHNKQQCENVWFCLVCGKNGSLEKNAAHPPPCQIHLMVHFSLRGSPPHVCQRTIDSPDSAYRACSGSCSNGFMVAGSRSAARLHAHRVTGRGAKEVSSPIFCWADDGWLGATSRPGLPLEVARFSDVASWLQKGRDSNRSRETIHSTSHLVFFGVQRLESPKTLI